jgi:crossover junction endodeoxyribonuclease RuvC
MVQRLLRLDASPGPDAADALACAICHAHGSHGLGGLAGAGARRRGGRALGG